MATQKNTCIKLSKIKKKQNKKKIHKITFDICRQENNSIEIFEPYSTVDNNNDKLQSTVL